MLDSEIYILNAVHTILKQKLGLTDQQCNIEFDEMVPAIAGDLYVAIQPGGIQPGPKHNPSQLTEDYIHGVTVSVIQRCTAKPRDERRSVFMDQLIGINMIVSKVIRALEGQVDVLAVAGKLLGAAQPSAKRFITMLQVSRIDPKPRMANSELYDAVSSPSRGSTPYVAMVRAVTFTGLRRMEVVDQSN